MKGTIRVIISFQRGISSKGVSLKRSDYVPPFACKSAARVKGLGLFTLLDSHFRSLKK